MDSFHLEFAITPQPDEASCGISCLHAVYGYHGLDVSMDRLRQSVPHLPEGGTLTVYLGLDALQRGFRATIYTCDLQLFDPTWFPGDSGPPVDLIGKLRAQAMARSEPRLRSASEAYVAYLQAGGRLEMQDIDPSLLVRCLKESGPVIAGLSSTWLYRCAREQPVTFRSDDVSGKPAGHFVVLHGVDPAGVRVSVADPYLHRPYPGTHHYRIDTGRLIGAIHLGIMTNDAKLLVVEPGGQR